MYMHNMDYNKTKIEKDKIMNTYLSWLEIKPLNDGTQGFRFDILGVKGLTRKRQYKSRGFKFKTGSCMKALHLGKRSIYFERKSNKKTERKFFNFAGNRLRVI